MCFRRVLLFVLSCLTLFTIPAAAQATCTLSTTNRTVTICTPKDGSTVSTTFHVNAGTTDSSTVQYIELYVHYQLYALQHTSYLDATITVPSGSNQNLTVQAHDAAGVTFSKTIHVNVTGTAYSISPTNPTVSEGGTIQFKATKASTWTATCGTISSSGLFTAPLSQPSCKVTGKATDGSGNTASTNVSITSPVSVSPSTATTQVGKTQQFTANVAVTWKASCGSINSSGLFTAPSSAGSCTITGTAASGTAYTDTAIDTVVSSTSGTLNYTTWKFDNARDGLNSKETALTPSVVSSSKFGQLWTASIDGRPWAQPLYMSGVTIGSAKHNVIYAETSRDKLYAIDGDTGATLWSKLLIPSGETYANGDTAHSSVLPDIGITGTPVIDPVSGTLYLVTYSIDGSSNYHHRLHAVSITSGSEKFGGPIEITASGYDPSQHLQRPALTLANGNVYIAFGSNEDVEPYHGWVFGYNASTLSQIAVWNATPGEKAGAIWMGGAGLSADSTGNLFFSTGNGDWNGSTIFGQSVVKLSAGEDVLDYFTPVAHSTESSGDKDLGSGGILLLPTLSSTHPHEMISCGKVSQVYVLDRDNMGQIGTTTDNAVQTLTGQIGGTSGLQYKDACFSTPAYFNGNVYFIGNNDGVKQFSLSSSTGLLSSTPTHKDTFVIQFPGGQPVISSNGNSNGILWTMDWKNGGLRAYDASNVSNVLYVSAKLGEGIKWTVPTVINGHVYIGFTNKIVALGIKAGSSCAAPSSPGAVICTPANNATVSSPFSVTAAGTPNSGASTVRMELWMDGKKINNYSGSSISTTVSASAGSHYLTAVEVDSTGANLKSTHTNITVQ
jgi:hypothetical protein